MPQAPSLGLFSGARAGGDRLYQMVAEQTARELAAAKYAEEIRQKRFEEMLKLGQLDVNELEARIKAGTLRQSEAEWLWKLANPEQATERDVLDAQGQPSLLAYNKYGGGNRRSLGQLYKEPKTATLTGQAGPKANTPYSRIVDLLKPPGAAPIYESEEVPSETLGDPMTLTMPGATTPTTARFSNRSLMPRELPGVQLNTTDDINTFEGENFGWYQTMRYGNEIMRDWEPFLTKRDKYLMHRARTWDEVTRETLMSEAGKHYLQGARAFIEAFGRKGSRAQINVDEWRSFQSQALPGLTTSPSVAKEKENFRNVQLDSLAFLAGDAYSSYYKHPYQPRYGTDASKRTENARPATYDNPADRAEALAAARGGRAPGATATAPAARPPGAAPAPRSSEPAARSSTPSTLDDDMIDVPLDELSGPPARSTPPRSSAPAPRSSTPPAARGVPLLPPAPARGTSSALPSRGSLTAPEPPRGTAAAAPGRGPASAALARGTGGRGGQGGTGGRAIRTPGPDGIIDVPMDELLQRRTRPGGLGSTSTGRVLGRASGEGPTRR